MDIKRLHQQKMKQTNLYKYAIKTDRYGNESYGFESSPSESFSLLWLPISSESVIAEYGERVNEMLQACLFDDAQEISEHDRVEISGIMYNVITIKPYPSYRLIIAERVK